MAKKPTEEIDLAMVEELIFGPNSLELERFTRAETLYGRTPDFRIKRNGKTIGFCEVKSPRDDWLIDQLDASHGEIVGGARSDPTFNRVARHIEKSVTQFDAVNGDRQLFNILVFVNHDNASNVNDLYETVTGYFLANDGTRYATMMKIAQGRLGKARERIDLYIWIDAKTKRVQGYLLNDAEVSRLEAVRDLLRLKKAD